MYIFIRINARLEFILNVKHYGYIAAKVGLNANQQISTSLIEEVQMVQVSYEQSCCFQVLFVFLGGGGISCIYIYIYKLGILIKRQICNTECTM